MTGRPSLLAALCAALAAACLGLAVYGAILGRRLDAARKDAAAWEAGAASQRAALKELEASREALSAALARRESELTKAALERAARRKAFKEAASHDETVENWSRVRLPDAVRGLLR